MILSRAISLSNPASAVALAAAPPHCHQLQPARSMATLKAISMRLRSVTNIQKITKSMKMVSAAKYARAERELKSARAFGVGARAFYDAVDVDGSGQSEQPPTPDKDAPGQILVAVTSDRGLCGAVHSNVAKSIKNNYDPNGDYRIVCIGDKSRNVLQRSHGKRMLFHVSEVGKKSPSFGDARAVAQEILKSGYEFKSGKIFFNIFRSVVSYKTTDMPVFSVDAVESAPSMTVYDSLDTEVLNSYLEFSLASLIYFAMKEGACSEQSSRMTAMDNASKNAGEMIQKLQLSFNRTRQAVITRELIEIISGAAAV